MQRLWRRSFTTILTAARRANLTTDSTMHCSSECDKTFKETIVALNSLQSNAATILQTQSQKPSHLHSMKKLYNTILYLQSTGVDSSELQKLSVIHVTGTKGKGSTSSLCETILRKNGFRTGFFSSPHLISVRERIQINGKPIEEQKFIRHFWEVKQALNHFEDTEIGLPHYFNFLFVMAVNVFLKEQVDVAIMEVGIGGQYDTTNVLPNVAVVGITSIGLDHLNILGSTIADIAWQKAGIMKPCALAFTIPNQIPEAMEVLLSRSQELKCPLSVVPTLDELTCPNDTKKMMMKMPRVHQTNAALALQLSEAWLRKTGGESLNTDCIKEVRPTAAIALESWRMPGRMQVLSGIIQNAVFFLDGAHTPESTVECLEWFKIASKECFGGMQTHQALISNVTGARNLKSVLEPLFSHNFDQVYFTPNIAYANNNLGKSGECWSSMDMTNFQQKRLLELEVLWTKERPMHLAPSQNVRKVHCVAEAVDDLKAVALHSKPVEWHILITGSLHLVGSALTVLDPNLDQSYSKNSQ